MSSAVAMPPAAPPQAPTDQLHQDAQRHVGQILELAIAHQPERNALIVSDGQSALARCLSRAYQACLPAALHIDFDAVSPAEVLLAFEPLQPGDLVVLIQSTSFRLEAFRIRVELFKRGLKVIEHPHLGRMLAAEHPTYVAALAYDAGYYRGVGRALQQRIDAAHGAVVESGGGARLTYQSAFEPAKMNIGDYAAMKNVGGQFPIGEVFTEAKDLQAVNGDVRIFVFGDTEFRVNVPPQPITLIIREGKVVQALDTTVEFERVLANIRADEDPWIRELGFGMNRALSPERRVSDIGTYERMCGIHLSLGAKHGVYNKPQLKRRDAKYHVDVFAITERVSLDGETVFGGGGWTVS